MVIFHSYVSSQERVYQLMSLNMLGLQILDPSWSFAATCDRVASFDTPGGVGFSASPTTNGADVSSRFRG